VREEKNNFNPGQISPFFLFSLRKRSDVAQREFVAFRKEPFPPLYKRFAFRSFLYSSFLQGKCIEVSFDFKGDPIGGLITNCEFVAFSCHNRVSLLSFTRAISSDATFFRREELSHLLSTLGRS